jgi:hypothetical protein
MKPSTFTEIKRILHMRARKIFALFSLAFLSFTVTFAQPSWVAGAPAIPSTGALSITANYGINVTGTIYIVGYSYVAGLPDPATVKSEALAGVAGTRVIATAITINAGNRGLLLQTIFDVVNANTTHTIFFVAQNSSGVLQASFVRIEATTLPCPSIKLQTYFGNIGECVNLGAQGMYSPAKILLTPTGVLKGTIWFVDWGDGTTWNYASTADDDIPAAQIHTYTYPITECAYVGRQPVP